MNKINPRLQPNHQISKIQANLKQMRDEVNGFLKKNNKDTIPPILRARHYLLLDTINHLGTTSIESPRQLIKDLSSEALMPMPESQRFEPLRRSEKSQKKEKNKIIKQKKTLTGHNSFYHRAQAQQSCLLPNICNLKLDYDDKFIVFTPAKKQFKEEKHIEDPQILNEQAQKTFATSRRYRSIDLGNQSSLSDMRPEDIKSTLKGSKTKWLQRSLYKHLPHHELKQKTIQTKFNEVLTESMNHIKQIKPQHEESQLHPLDESFFKQPIIDPQNTHILVRRNIFKKVGKQLSKGKIVTTARDKIHSDLHISQSKPVKESRNDLSKLDPWENEGPEIYNQRFFLANDIY